MAVDLMALIGGDEPSAQEQAKAYATALRRKGTIGELAALGGGRLSKVGDALAGEQAQGEGILAQAASGRASRAASASEGAAARAFTGTQNEANRANESKHWLDQLASIANEGKASRGNQLQIARENNAAELQRAAMAAAAARAKSEEDKRLPATSVEQLSDLPAAIDQVDQLKGTFDRLNMGGAAGRFGNMATNALGLANTDSAEYNAAAKLAMQAAGKILEGGKLAAGDEIKYAAMLPRAGDSKEVVEQKTQSMKSFLQQLGDRRKKAFDAAGYRVPAELVAATQAHQQPASAPAPAKQPKLHRLPSGEIVEVE